MVKINTNDLQKILALIEKIEEIEKSHPLLAKIPLPYTVGGPPEPKTWENQGIRDKLL